MFPTAEQFEYRPIGADTPQRESDAEKSAAPIGFTGRLRVINLHDNSCSITDDVGNKVVIRHANVDPEVYGRIGDYVTAIGRTIRDASGQLTGIEDASICPAPPLPANVHYGPQPSRSREDLFRNAPTADELAIPGLTDEEADAFLNAMGLR